MKFDWCSFCECGIHHYYKTNFSIFLPYAHRHMLSAEIYNAEFDWWSFSNSGISLHSQKLHQSSSTITISFRAYVAEKPSIYYQVVWMEGYSSKTVLSYSSWSVLVFSRKVIRRRQKQKESVCWGWQPSDKRFNVSFVGHAILDVVI